MKARERIIFDDDAYVLSPDDMRRDEAETLLDYFAVDLDIDDPDKVPEGERADLVARISDDEINNYLHSRRSNDWDFEKELLRDTLGSGEREGMPLIVCGAVSRWDGISSGYEVVSDLDALLDTRSGPLKDCEQFKLWDENGCLKVRGIHHDGQVNLEVRVLTHAGQDAYFDLESEIDPVIGIHDIFSDEQFSELPRHAEYAWGAPAEEWKSEPRKLDEIPIGTHVCAQPSPGSSWVRTENGSDGEPDYYLDVYEGRRISGDAGALYMDGESCTFLGVNGKTCSFDDVGAGWVVLDNDGCVFAVRPEQFEADFGSADIIIGNLEKNPEGASLDLSALEEIREACRSFDAVVLPDSPSALIDEGERS